MGPCRIVRGQERADHFGVMVDAFRLRPSPERLRREIIEQRSGGLGRVLGQLVCRGNRHEVQAVERALLDGVERADGFHDRAEELDADGPRLGRRPEIDDASSMRRLALLLDFGLEIVAGGGQSFDQLFRLDLLRHADGFLCSCKQVGSGGALEQCLHASDDHRGAFRAHALLQRKQSVADQVGMGCAAPRGGRFARGEEGYVGLPVGGESGDVLVEKPERTRAVGNPHDGDGERVVNGEDDPSLGGEGQRLDIARHPRAEFVRQVLLVFFRQTERAQRVVHPSSTYRCRSPASTPGGAPKGEPRSSSDVCSGPVSPLSSPFREVAAAISGENNSGPGAGYARQTSEIH
ncbi:MAG: hypothetical protein BWY59_02297 [Verrucomicrobia bacterium ADurb.Bin345]|nr:MAG: hypothetical protein BWY59_02297 [Verrucomicrobia bacterium ADurb.Bin345]